MLKVLGKVSWTDSLEEATALSLQDLSTAVHDSTFWSSVFDRFPISQKQLDGTYQQLRGILPGLRVAPGISENRYTFLVPR